MMLSVLVPLGAVGFVFYMLPLNTKAGELMTTPHHVPGQVFKSYMTKRTPYAEFSYTVNKVLYSAKSEISQVVQSGDPVEVYYIPSDPGFASVAPQKTGIKFQFTTLLSGGMLVFMSVVWVYARQRYRQTFGGRS